MKLSFRGSKSLGGNPGIPAFAGMTVPVKTTSCPGKRRSNPLSSIKHTMLRAGDESRTLSVKGRLLLFTLLAALGGTASAGEYRLGDLVVIDPWAREMPPVSETGAVWFRVVNHGGADQIVSVQSPFAERTELHTHELEDGVAKMRHLPSVEVPAHGNLLFEPGDRHVMLIGLEEALVAGESFTMTIRFAHAGEMNVQVQVRSSEMAGYGGISSHSDHSEDSGELFDSRDSPEALA